LQAVLRLPALYILSFRRLSLRKDVGNGADLRGPLKNLPAFASQAIEAGLVALAAGRFAGHVANEDAGDLFGKMPRQLAINLRVFFPRVAHQNEAAARKRAQDRLDLAMLEALRRRQQAEHALIFPADRLQVKRAGRKTVRADELRQHRVQLPRTG